MNGHEQVFVHNKNKNNKAACFVIFLRQKFIAFQLAMNELSGFLRSCSTLVKFHSSFPSFGRYFFRVLLEKLNSSMCAMCFPVGSSPQRLDSETMDGLAMLWGSVCVELLET